MGGRHWNASSLCRPASQADPTAEHPRCCSIVRPRAKRTARGAGCRTHAIGSGWRPAAHGDNADALAPVRQGGRTRESRHAMLLAVYVERHGEPPSPATDATFTVMPRDRCRQAAMLSGKRGV